MACCALQRCLVSSLAVSRLCKGMGSSHPVADGSLQCSLAASLEGQQYLYVKEGGEAEQRHDQRYNGRKAPPGVRQLPDAQVQVLVLRECGASSGVATRYMPYSGRMPRCRCSPCRLVVHKRRRGKCCETSLLHLLAPQVQNIAYLEQDDEGLEAQEPDQVQGEFPDEHPPRPGVPLVRDDRLHRRQQLPPSIAGSLRCKLTPSFISLGVFRRRPMISAALGSCCRAAAV